MAFAMVIAVAVAFAVAFAVACAVPSATATAKPGVATCLDNSQLSVSGIAAIRHKPPRPKERAANTSAQCRRSCE